MRVLRLLWEAVLASQVRLQGEAGATGEQLESSGLQSLELRHGVRRHPFRMRWVCIIKSIIAMIA